MAIVVVGGHSRSVGKTSVVTGLIAALREYRWTAMKITQYGHGMCSENGQPCACAGVDHSWAASEETDLAGQSDSSRFLAAGAAQSWWVRSEQGRLAEAMARVREILARSDFAIIESNSILKFLKADLYLTVLNPQIDDFKPSAQNFLDRADAVLLHGDRISEKISWAKTTLTPVAGRPTFGIHPPEYVTAEIVEFIRERLRTYAGTHTQP